MCDVGLTLLYGKVEPQVEDDLLTCQAVPSMHMNWFRRIANRFFLFSRLSFKWRLKTYFWQVYGVLTFHLCSQIPLDNMTNEMEQRVEPHNDYFSTQFLLNFVILGTHNITVESSVIDSNGIVWKTGPKTTIFVKSLEDPYSQQVRLQQQQQQQGPAPAQQQQQRTAYSRF